MYYIRDIIEKKREKERLTDDEIRFFILGYQNNEITDAQAAALMTAMHIYGLNESEMLAMIKAIVETGEEFNFDKVANKVIDIHAIGGISDKVVLILMSILHSIGQPVAKVIGRELGMEDRLLSLDGYMLEENIDNFKNNIKNKNMGILKSIENLAPVENKLYKLRHEIACDNDIQLIAISIMSQKVALGFSNLFFEITYGDNAYIKTLADAKLLSKYLVNIGKKFMKNVSCCVTSLNSLVGNSFGNLVELREVYKFLNGRGTADLIETVIKFGSNLLRLAGVSDNKDESKKIIIDSIKSGNALKSFRELLSMQGGNSCILEQEIKVKNIVPVIARGSGYVTKIDVNKLRMLNKHINSIRGAETDYFDIGAGVVFEKQVGDAIQSDEVLAYVYTNNDAKVEETVNKVRESITISKKNVSIQRVFFEI